MRTKFLVESENFLKKRKKSAAAVGAVIIIVAGAAIFWLTNKSEPASEPEYGGTVYDVYAERLPDLKKAVDDDSENANARSEYAVALSATGDMEKAAEQYEKAVELNPNDALGYNNLGNTYRDLNELDKAVAAYQKSVEINSQQLNPYINLANVQLQYLNQGNEAIATYKKALEAQPGEENLMLQLALAYKQLGRTAEAKGVLNELIGKGGDKAEAAKKVLEGIN